MLPGRPHEVLSDIFHGTIIAYVDGLPSDCLGHIIVRGQFCRAVRCSEVLTGQAFDAPLHLLPHPRSFLTSMLLSMLRAWSPHTTVSFGPRPYILTPVIASASRILCRRRLSVATDGSKDATSPEPPSPTPPVDDDLAMLAAQHPEVATSVVLGHKSRRRFFSKASSSEQYLYETGAEYSFHFIVRRLNLTTLQLQLPPPLNLRLGSYLGGQPLRLLGIWSPGSPPEPPRPGSRAGGTDTSTSDSVALWDLELVPPHGD